MKTGYSRFAAVSTTLAVLLSFGFIHTYAQELELGANFLVGLPQKDFRDNLSGNGLGLSGHVGCFLGNAPVMVGVNLGILNYGAENRLEPLTPTIPEFIVDVRTTNNILMFHGFARIQPQRGVIRPYFEGLWGFKYLFTRTTIREHWYDKPLGSSTSFDDFAGSSGLGAGVDIVIWKKSTKERKRIRENGVYEISLNISARHFWGSEAEYLTEGSIRHDPDGELIYYVHRSGTDLFVPQAGIEVRF